jgi:cell division protein FtsI (penicillin-binding protein 3)
MLVAMNAVLRNGPTLDTRVVHPHVLDRVVERNGENEYPFRSRAGRDSLVEQAPSAMVTESGRLLTAQGQKGVLDSVFLEDEFVEIRPVPTGSTYRRTRIMLGAVPADTPELSLLVVVRRPFLEPSSLATKKDEGKELDLSSPVVKILPTMVALQQVHKNIADMMSRSERMASNYQQTQKPKKETALATMLAEEALLMPDVVGLSMRKALRVLQDKKIKVRIQGTGRVVSQSPSAGMPLAKVQECRLSLKKDEKAVAKGTSSPAKGKKKTGAE